MAKNSKVKKTENRLKQASARPMHIWTVTSRRLREISKTFPRAAAYPVTLPWLYYTPAKPAVRPPSRRRALQVVSPLPRKLLHPSGRAIGCSPLTARRARRSSFPPCPVNAVARQMLELFMPRISAHAVAVLPRFRVARLGSLAVAAANSNLISCPAWPDKIVAKDALEKLSRAFALAICEFIENLFALK